MIDGVVRQAMPADRQAIRDVNTRAFGREDEARIIDRLEADGDAMWQAVAETEGRIVGHILFYPVGVRGKLGAVGLGPMCVDPDVQRAGIGGSLIDTSLKHLQAAGAPIVFVLGHPAYYPRFGFSVETTEPFQTSLKGPAFMAMRLRGGPPLSGELVFPRAFGI